MANIDFEGTEVPIKAGDTIAAALYRGGMRIFSRSFKYHRPRGLYCVGGDCPNCLVDRRRRGQRPRVRVPRAASARR